MICILWELNFSKMFSTLRLKHEETTESKLGKQIDPLSALMEEKQHKKNKIQ